MKLLIFPTPLDAHCVLSSDDNGIAIIGKPDTHSSGRKGQSFDIGTGVVNGHGCRLVITAKDKVDLIQRGILYFNLPYSDSDYAVLIADDFVLSDLPAPIIISPPNPPAPNPTPNTNPIDIINSVYNTGNFNLATKEGCGKFTEAVADALHNKDSREWGHLRKSGAQNQYNGHAVDAIMLLNTTSKTRAGIYDIITDSESSNARPALNPAGNVIPELWYYPA